MGVPSHRRYVTPFWRRLSRQRNVWHICLDAIDPPDYTRATHMQGLPRVVILIIV